MSRTLTVQVTFPRSKISHPSIYSVRIQEREYLHDVAVIVLDQTLGLHDSYQSRAPVTVTIGYAPDRLKTFNGYVNHVEAKAEIGGKTRTQIVCLGASYPMKKTRQKKWSGTPTQIAAQIVNSYKFNPRFFPVREAKIPSLVQHNESDFKFMCNLAKKIGYTFFVKNTEVNFYPRNTKFERHRNNALVFGDPASNTGTIYKFWPTVGETMTDDKAIHVAQGVTQQGAANVLTDNQAPSTMTGKTAYKPQFFKFHNDIVTKNPTEAEMYLHGKAEAGRYYIRAHVLLDGDARLTQAEPIILRNLSEASGFWFVEEIEHRVTKDGYKMEVVVSRDSYGDTSAGLGNNSTGGSGVLGGDEGVGEPTIPFFMPILGSEEISANDFGVAGTGDVTPSIADAAFDAPTPPTVAVDLETWTTTPPTDGAGFYTSGIPEEDLLPPAPFGEQGTQSQYQDPTAAILQNVTFTWQAQCRTTPYSDLMDVDMQSPAELQQIPHLRVDDTIC